MASRIFVFVILASLLTGTVLLVPRGATGSKSSILVVQNSQPRYWYTDNALNQLGISHDTVNVSEFASMNISQYKIIIVGTQIGPAEEVNSYLDNVSAEVQGWVNSGGCLAVFGQYFNGTLIDLNGQLVLGANQGSGYYAWLPGQPGFVSVYTEYVNIIDHNHPITKNFTDYDLSNWGTSADGYFILTSGETPLAVHQGYLDRPVLYAKTLGLGKIVGTGLDPDYHGFIYNSNGDAGKQMAQKLLISILDWFTSALSLSATVTPSTVVMFIGQSLSFNSTVSGGTSPYTYQWYLNYSPVLNATSSSWTFTATSYSSYTVYVIVTDSVGVIAISNTATVTVSVPLAVYFSVEPVAVEPLTDINASINGLETPSTRSPVGENFTVEIHLGNATTTNVPAGVQGVDVRFDFSSILNYCRPIGFTNELGQPGSALNGPVDTLINGFFNVFPTYGNVPLPPPYANATQYVLVAASFDGSWNGNDGLVAKITFQITGQPSQNMSQPDFYGPLQIYFEDIADANANDIPSYVTQGTLRIDSADPSSLVGDLNSDGKVGLQDLILLANAYNSKLGDQNWNPLADIAPPYGTISLTDLVTMAIHYGQHNP